MSGVEPDARPGALRAAAAGLAACPGLTEDEAAALLGHHPREAASLLAGLRRLGWAEAPVLPVPGGPPARRWFLTAAADGLVRASPAGAALPAGRRERLLRALQPELTALVNGYLAALRAAARAAGLQARVWQLPRGGAGPWPPAAAAAAVLGNGSGWATLFIAADRRALPASRRRERVSAWAAWYAAEPRRAAAPLVCLVPGPLEAREYGLAAAASAGRRGAPAIPLLLAPAVPATRDPLGGHYRPAGFWFGAELLARAPARRGPLLPPPAPSLPDPALSPLPPGPALLPPPDGGAGRERGLVRDAARLAGLDGLHLEILALAAFHPPLGVAELAAFTGAAPELAARLAGELAGRGLLTAGPDGYAATPAGARLAWLREGVATRGAGAGGDRPSVRPHDAGVRRFFAAAAAALRAAGGALLGFREAHWCPVTPGPGGPGLVPDGVATVRLDGGNARWYLELDRGTEHVTVPAASPYRERTLLEKCRRYDVYLRTLLQEKLPAAELPWVLLVTTSPHREQELWEELLARPWPLLPDRLLTTYGERLAAGGPLGPVWKSRPLLGAGRRTPPPPRLSDGARRAAGTAAGRPGAAP